MSKPINESGGYHGDTSDFLTIDRALAGDQSAYEELFKKYQKRIFYLLMRLTKNNAADSEDLLQNTFFSAFSKLRTFKKSASFYTWLYRIAGNVFLLSCRRKKYCVIPIEELCGQQNTREGLIVETSNDQHAWNDKKNDIGRLDYALENVPNGILVSQLLHDLSPGYKKVFELHDLQRLKYKEVATILGCSPGNAKSQRHKAIKKLRRTLQITHM